jgi:hypothetical protein
MVKMTDYCEWNHRLSGPERLDWTWAAKDGSSIHSISLPGGIVLAYVYRARPDGVRYTVLKYALDGWAWNRSWRTEWRPRTITRLAREMVSEIRGRVYGGDR